MKDNFSAQSNEYKKFRPAFPDDLMRDITALVKKRDLAWDCGTGNGQIAALLSPLFEQVVATDISESQIRNAIPKGNIRYVVEPAENPSLEDCSVDLIVAAQAVHWFEFDRFYAGVTRVLKKDGVIALIGYPLMTVSDEVDQVVHHFYENVLKEYWDKERRYVEQQYQTIPFPFEEIKIQSREKKYRWSLDQLLGFLNTWSAVQHFRSINNQNPVEGITNELVESWGAENEREITFEMFARVGKLHERAVDF